MSFIRGLKGDELNGRGQLGFEAQHNNPHDEIIRCLPARPRPEKPIRYQNGSRKIAMSAISGPTPLCVRDLQLHTSITPTMSSLWLYGGHT